MKTDKEIIAELRKENNELRGFLSEVKDTLNKVINKVKGTHSKQNEILTNARFMVENMDELLSDIKPIIEKQKIVFKARQKGGLRTEENAKEKRKKVIEIINKNRIDVYSIKKAGVVHTFKKYGLEGKGYSESYLWSVIKYLTE